MFVSVIRLRLLMLLRSIRAPLTARSTATLRTDSTAALAPATRAALSRTAPFTHITPTCPRALAARPTFAHTSVCRVFT